MTIREAYPFHVTRNADFEIQELEASDLLEVMEESVRNRRFGKVVRLMVQKDMPEALQELLAENLNMDKRDIYPLDLPLNLQSLMDLYKMELPYLKDRLFHQNVIEKFRSQEGLDYNKVFATIRSRRCALPSSL